MGSRICLGSETPGDCIYNIPEDSFVRHVSRHFHGTRILLRKGKCLEEIAVGVEVRGLTVIIWVCILSKQLEQIK